MRKGTIRENITFGRPFERQRYDEAVDAVALADDLLTMERGDLTEVGDRGASLSGGQQSRIALARVVYAAPALALLDEPLASLDPQTRAHVWQHALLRLKRGGSAIVLTSSSAQAGLHAEFTLLLSAGRVVQCGPSAALAATAGPFSEMLAESSDAAPSVPSTPAHAPSPLFPSAQLGRAPAHTPLAARASAASFASAPAPPAPPPASVPPSKAGEDRDVGSEGGGAEAGAASAHVPAAVRRELESVWRVEGGKEEIATSVHQGYARRFGWNGAGLLVAVALFGLAQGSLVLYDVYLARWSSLPPSQQQDLTSNLGGLAGLAGLAAGLVGGQAALWAILSLLASDQTHSGALRQVLRAPI